MAANQDGKSPGLVRVQICLSREQAPKFQEKIKRSTKRHELVEVEDFVYRRKRKAVAPSPAAAPPPPAAEPQGQPGTSPSAAAAIKQGLQLEARSPAAAAAAAAALQGDDAIMTDQAAEEEGTAVPDADVTVPGPAVEGAVAPEQRDMGQQQQQLLQEQEQEQVQGEREATEEDGPLAAAVAAAGPAQMRFSVAPSELCDLVEWVFLNERKKLPGTTAESARVAAAQFRQAFSKRLQQHAAANTAAAGPDAAAEEQGQEGGTASGAPTQAAATTPQLMVLPYLVEQQKAALQDKRTKLLQEEVHWLELQQQYNDMHAAAAGGAVADAATAGVVAADAEAAKGDKAAATKCAETAGPAAAEPGAAGTRGASAARAAAAEAAGGRDDSVCAQQEGKMRGVQLKVEMLLALVSKMEHLVSSAEAAARTLQAGYHAEKFKVFPHINSPAALIKSIISSQQAADAAGAAEAAAAKPAGSRSSGN